MLHLIDPTQTWIILYASLFAIFLLQMLFHYEFEISIQNFIVLSSLGILTITEYGLIPKTQIITQSILFFTSLSLISQKISKKMIFYLLAVTAYFIGLAIAESLNIQNKILPIISLFVLFALHQTYTIIPNDYKKNTHFLLIIILILENLVTIESHFFAWIYAIFAAFTIVRAFIFETKENKIFYSFFSFFIITISYTLFNKIAIHYADYLFFYATIAFFLYEISQKFKCKIFLLPVTFATLHIAYTIFNPSFFLIKQIQTTKLLTSSFYIISDFIYFAIFVTIIKSLFLFYNQTQKQIGSQFQWIPFVSILSIFAILFEVEIIHNILTPSISIIYSSVSLSIILHAIYLLITYSILCLLQFVIKKHLIQYKVPKFKFPKLKRIDIDYNPKNIFMIINKNLVKIYSYNFFLIPIFLIFYLLISFF